MDAGHPARAIASSESKAIKKPTEWWAFFRPAFAGLWDELACSLLFLCQRLHRQTQAAFLVGFQNLHAHRLAFLQIVGNAVDALVGDLRDVQQAVLARQHADNRAEIEQLQHGAIVDAADFDFSRDFLDATLRRFAAFGRDAGDRHGAVVVDVDRGAGFFGDARG